jgi:hypothetical protein
MFVALFQLIANGNLSGVHVAPKTKIRNQYQDNKRGETRNEEATHDRIACSHAAKMTFFSYYAGSNSCA